jgi:hypothetical protein
MEIKVLQKYPFGIQFRNRRDPNISFCLTEEYILLEVVK